VPTRFRGERLRREAGRSCRGPFHVRQAADRRGLAVVFGRGRFGRRIPDIDKLMRLPVSVQARLRRVEVIAVVLYTGPMVSASRPWACRAQ
jgi:hypothetical protein